MEIICEENRDSSMGKDNRVKGKLQRSMENNGEKSGINTK